MKRHGNLFEQIIDIENLKRSHESAKKGKLHYKAVKEIEEDPERYLLKIQQMLIDGTFNTSPYIIMQLQDGSKLRTIHKLPYFPDRIVQHALINIIGPIFLRSFIRDTFQAIPGRGTSDAARRVKLAIRTGIPKYGVKLDIKKYYQSIDTDILKQLIRIKIKCEKTLWLIDNIVDSTQGLPIGNYTSQYFGNIYLYQFDWYVKQQLGLKHYYRYCDDIVFIIEDKQKITPTILKIQDYLNTLKLSIKSPIITNIYRDGLDFVGFVFFDKFTLLRQSLALNFKKKVISIKHTYKLMSRSQVISGIMAYKGWIKQASAKVLWRSQIHAKFLKYAFNFNKCPTDKLYGVV